MLGPIDDVPHGVYFSMKAWIKERGVHAIWRGFLHEMILKEIGSLV